MFVCSFHWHPTTNFSIATIFNPYKEIFTSATSRDIFILGEALENASGAFTSTSALQFQFVSRND